MIELLDALRLFLLDDTDLASDDSGEQPYDFEPMTLYVWEESSLQRPIGADGEVREDFVIVAAITERTGEEAFGKRSRATSLVLDGHRTRMLTLIREHSSVQDQWDHIEGASVPSFLRQLEQRGIAVRISGYRIID